MEFLGPIQDKRRYYEAHSEEVEQILLEGTEAARNQAKNVMSRVKDRNNFVQHTLYEVIRSITSDLTNLKFGNSYSNDYTNADYDKIIKVGNEYGYYYLFKKIDGKYVAYRSDITKKDELMYLFTTSSLNNLIFNDDYIYYVSDGSLKYYSDETGNRTVLSNA